MQEPREGQRARERKNPREDFLLGAKPI